ncbi:MAG: DUF3592 domain-containing protein [Bradyrhizobium sp.]|nr:DUF3592 domain-containing protein [Bradyrhizobium sp.]
MIDAEHLHWARIAAGILALLIANQGVGIWRYRRKTSHGLKWPWVEGTISTSTIEADDTDGANDEADDAWSSVLISYSYAVNGKTYKGSRIIWGGKTVMPKPAAQILSTRYPVGASVRVFYDPRKPRSALLEPRHQGNSVAMSAMVLFLIVFSVIEIGLLPLAVLGYNPSTPGGVPLFAFFLPIVCGVVSIGSFWSYLQVRRMASASLNWPRVTGKVVSATVSTVNDRDSRDTGSTVNHTTTKFRANIHYTYSVAQCDYTSTAVTLGWTPLYGFRQDAQAVTSKYAVGTPVDVYYDPGNPYTAVLQPGMKDGTQSSLIFSAMFGGGGAIFFWAFAIMHTG